MNPYIYEKISIGKNSRGRTEVTLRRSDDKIVHMNKANYNRLLLQNRVVGYIDPPNAPSFKSSRNSAEDIRRGDITIEFDTTEPVFKLPGE